MNSHSEERIETYRHLLTVCDVRNCENVFQSIADRFEDDLLEVEEFPENYFGFVLELLGNESLFSKPGVWNFLLVLSTEQGKLLPQHYEMLARCLVSNYARYENSDLCLAACDFVARNYSAVEARAILGRLSAIEQNKAERLHGYVKEGLRILAAEEVRSARKKTS